MKTFKKIAACLFLVFITAAIQERPIFGKKVVKDSHGAIVRGDLSQKELALVFTSDEFADGGEIIQKVLKKNNVSAAFFLTGNFYTNPAFKSLITQLKNDGHYMGAHSDKHLLYADWEKVDSLLVSKKEFKQDLENNYKRMAAFGIKKSDALYFLPPYEWYNSTITKWTSEAGLQLINFSPGTRSTADYTYPEMVKRYRSSEEIYNSIIEYEAKDPNGLNGFILLIHIGTDPRRKDKFYFRLDKLIKEIKSGDYDFVRLDKLLR
ncbi:MAG TPA: polysaccharide deacetylase family protein [Cytophagales bacterium]|nr:polysaccharide deacetylase family protein [Cytophagales bacterium]